MRQHLSQYYKVIEQNSLPIPHSIVREHDFRDYKRQKILAPIMETKIFCLFAPSAGLTFDIVRYRS